MKKTAVSKELQKEMNAAYDRLEKKQDALAHAFSQREFESESGWFNGHYQKNEDGSFSRDSYPIPVISVKGVCDMEIQFDRIDVSTKLKREKALTYSFDKMADYPFEAYGVEDYLGDYYHEGQSIQELRDNILDSEEKEIGFSFTFSFDAEGEKILEFVTLLRREGFYY